VPEGAVPTLEKYSASCMFGQASGRLCRISGYGCGGPTALAQTLNVRYTTDRVHWRGIVHCGLWRATVGRRATRGEVHRRDLVSWWRMRRGIVESPANRYAKSEEVVAVLGSAVPKLRESR
jgi:hypothetical protein